MREPLDKDISQTGECILNSESNRYEYRTNEYEREIIYWLEDVVSDRLAAFIFHQELI